MPLLKLVLQLALIATIIAVSACFSPESAAMRSFCHSWNKNFKRSPYSIQDAECVDLFETVPLDMQYVYYLCGTCNMRNSQFEIVDAFIKGSEATAAYAHKLLLYTSDEKTIAEIISLFLTMDGLNTYHVTTNHNIFSALTDKIATIQDPGHFERANNVLNQIGFSDDSSIAPYTPDDINCEIMFDTIYELTRKQMITEFASYPIETQFLAILCGSSARRTTMHISALFMRNNTDAVDFLKNKLSYTGNDRHTHAIAEILVYGSRLNRSDYSKDNELEELLVTRTAGIKDPGLRERTHALAMEILKRPRR